MVTCSVRGVSLWIALAVAGGCSAAAPRGVAGAGAARAAGAVAPGQLLDLGSWKLTLPIGSAGHPTEIKGEALRTFVAAPYFCANAAGDGVVFHAHAGGVTTPQSSYPRSELREMRDGGLEPASWSTASGRHLLAATMAVTHLPDAKPHVVVAQIHDQEDDVVMIRLERSHLFVEGGGSELGELDSAYRLGTRFTIKLEAAAGHVRVYYQDMTTPRVDVERAATGCYFKAGVYTQSNRTKGDAGDAYGEVVISKLAVSHA
jgi:hypothetical protein